SCHTFVQCPRNYQTEKEQRFVVYVDADTQWLRPQFEFDASTQAEVFLMQINQSDAISPSFYVFVLKSPDLGGLLKSISSKTPQDSISLAVYHPHLMDTKHRSLINISFQHSQCFFATHAPEVEVGAEV